ncbi:MAG: DNA recombination/repair protein RecA, partial [Ruminococcus sp.]|nr:DNA recombination/repair protein RecA [Ruminococcus sp.]
KKSGSCFIYNDQKLCHGRDNVKELLANNPELMQEIEEKILARKDEITSEKSSKKDKKGKAGIIVAESVEKQKNSDESDILANIDEDFDEFTPADE